ncbi:EamA family transporter [Nocardioides ferulae]|uniref:EamA family transporter n=1 Tax=Nocardioides ferulae TaxID=2340821 RepID=UPI000EACD22F|nr:EamA family transporter [Nocardioides ferulae]
MAVTLALLAALFYGTADFVAGIATNRVRPWISTFMVVLSGAFAASVGWAFSGGTVGATDLTWIVVAGVGLGLGSLVLYRGLATGRMGVVAPISGVGAALVPVLVGILVGERPDPLAWLGMLLALPAIWLVARPPASSSASSTGIVDGILAGVGFGVLFAGLGQMPESAGLLPVALTNFVAAVVVGLLALLVREPVLAWEPLVLVLVPCGLVGALGTGLFMVATRFGYLSVTGVITALYPAVTVLLAAVLLREKIHLAQLLGLSLCAGAVTLVAAS